MSQHYSDPSRESDPHALPDVEVWKHHHPGGNCEPTVSPIQDEDGTCAGAGWYYQWCLPGCLPDSDPVGPWQSEDAAIAAMREECAE